MSKTIPICFTFFTTTHGHFGRHTDWRTTLNHWDRQIPLSLFGARLCHLKTFPSERERGAEMAAELRDRGFKVIETVGEFRRGLSMGNAYLEDQARVSNDPLLHTQPFMMLVEDDFCLFPRELSVEQYLVQSCRMMDQNHEMLSARTRRSVDDRGPEVATAQKDPRFFWSEHLNYQTPILRTRDFYQLGLVLEANPAARQQVHCEMLWALILQNFSRSPYRHLVWETDQIEAVHLGGPAEDHKMNLTRYNIAP